MVITKVVGVNFKCYKKVSANFSEVCNIFYGANGSGKTNLLDMLHFISLGKSYFSIPDKSAICTGEQFLRIEGNLKSKKDNLQLTISLPIDGKKKIKLNDTPISKATDLLGLMPLVCIVPDDIELVKGTTTIRRKFIDRIICQIDSNYTSALIKYQKTLAQKMAHLKNCTSTRGIDTDLIETYDNVLVENCIYLMKERTKFVLDFAPIFQSLYTDIAEAKEDVSIEYKTNVNEESYSSDLKKSLEHDYFSKRSQIGVHRDDLDFLIGNMGIRKYGSQGQIKTFVYALKLSEYLYLSQRSKTRPILLLDDIFEKLDRERLFKLFELVTSEKFGQIFITDTELERSLTILQELKTDYSSFEIKQGNLKSDNG